MTTKILTDKDFKNLLENKLSILLAHGEWTAKLDCGVKVLKYNSELFIFIHANSIEAVASGYVVELTRPAIVQKAEETYFTIVEQQDVAAQAKVLETISKLSYNLEGK